MKLSEAERGDLVRIKSFDSGCDTFRKRLEVLGLRRGDVVEVLQKSFLGPITVQAHGAKIALCRGQAKKIEVERLS
ncbi:MAG: ferrous iron transport protein A [Epsilonproteobacteria bacterium]|nr:ferrous iron transport protein A [Campylobacterota bacterium]NPA57275.1 ferrous iron transport protein A [Campylobacterota bacterium]